MLSRLSIEIVQQTLPAVEANATRISLTLYDRMMSVEPEIANMFEGGVVASSQVRALARTLVIYAQHLTGASGRSVDPLLAGICKKHVSAGVTAAHYSVVHRHLMWSFASVLGETMTPDIAAAWEEVYWHLADTLIVSEAAIVDEPLTR